MCADIYTVGLAVDATKLQQGSQQARTVLQQVTQAEAQLERQSAQTSRALTSQAREAATAAARLREQSRAAREAREVQLAATLNAQARALSAQAREARASAQAMREQARAAREAAAAAGGGIGGAARGLLGGGVAGGLTGALGGLAGGVAVSGITMAVGALKSLMSSASSTATEMLNLQTRLTATAGSAAGGAREFQTVSGLANRLGVDIADLAGQYASFTAAIKGTTLEGQKGRLAFEQISAGLARMGLSSEATQRALSALQQMVSKGTVAAEELRGQWGEAVPGGFQIAARAMGVTTIELGKLSEQGKLTGTAMVENLGKQMAAETGPALERVGVGATRLHNTLKELSTTMLGPVVRATDKAKDNWAGLLAGLFRTSAAMEKLRQTYATWAGVTAEQSQLVTNQQIADLERGTSAYQTEYQKRQQIVEGFHKAIAGAEQEARLAQTESVRMGGGPMGRIPFEADIGAARTTRETLDKQVAGIERFDRLSTALDKAKMQLKEVEKAYADLTEQMIKMPTLATSPAFMAERTALEQQALTLRANVTGMEDKAEADKKAAQAATTLADREVELQLRYEAKNITLKAGTEAGEAYEDRTNAMTEAEKRAEAQHLRRSSVLNAENRALERAAKLTKDWKDIEEEVQRAFDRATMTEEQLLDQRMKLAKVPAAKQDELRYLQEQAKLGNALTQQIKERDAFVAELETKLQAVNLALGTQHSLEEAIQIVEMDRLSETDAGLETLITQYDAVNERLARYRALRGEGTAGLGPEEAIAALRERGHTQGLVETFSPMDAAFQALTESTSRWDKSLQEAALTLQVQMPEAVDTFTSLVEDKFATIQDIAQELTGSILSSFQDLTEGGAKSFKDFANAVIQDLVRILQQRFLAPQMEKWIELGLGAATRILGSFGGGGTSLAAGTTALAGATGGSFFQSASGGPVRRGLTLVGEAGPEVIASSGGRSVVFPSSHPLTRSALASNGIRRRQYGGPMPDMGMDQGQTSEKPAMPGAVPPGSRNVIVNMTVYAQDASSFVQSRAAVQRAMAQAVRSSQSA